MTIKISMVVATAAIVASGGVAHGAEGDSVLLNTKNTSLALLRQNGVWNVAHYGAKVSAIDDAEALAWNQWAGDNSIAQRRPAAYAAYGGDKDGGYGFNKWGGLQVVHADRRSERGKRRGLPCRAGGGVLRRHVDRPQRTRSPAATTRKSSASPARPAKEYAQ